jgi:hypothetical protein
VETIGLPFPNGLDALHAADMKGVIKSVGFNAEQWGSSTNRRVSAEALGTLCLINKVQAKRKSSPQGGAWQKAFVQSDAKNPAPVGDPPPGTKLPRVMKSAQKADEQT